MKLPHTHKGFTIRARVNRNGKTVLEAWTPAKNKVAASYLPPMQVIYMGYSNPPVAYDHDILQLEKKIDNYLTKHQ